VVAFARAMRPPLPTSGKFTAGVVVLPVGRRFPGKGSLFGLPYGADGSLTKGTKACINGHSHGLTPNLDACKSQR